VADGGMMGRKEEIVLELISYKIVMDLLMFLLDFFESVY